MLFYQNQPTFTAFDGVALTNAYTGNRKAFETKGFSKLSLEVSYAMGAAETSNTLEFQLETSTDKVTWFPLVIDSTTTISAISARAWQMSEGELSILVDIANTNMRLSLKETGVASNAGEATVIVTLSGL